MAGERLMYDSTTPWDIPHDAEMVAYYLDGRYAWPQAWLDMFPRAIKVGISAIGVAVGQVGDVEVGCIWPPRNAVPWVRRSRAAGFDPTIYVNELNDWGPTRQAFIDAGEPEPYWWVARYNGVRVIPAGSVGRQFAHPHDGDGVADKPWETGKHYDLSIIAAYWPGVDTKENDVQLTDRMDNNFGTKPTVQQVWAAIDYNTVMANQKLDAITAMVGAVAKDPALSPARAEEIVRNAVEKGNATAIAEIQRKLDTALAVVADVVGSRDEDLAQEVVDEIGRRTSPQK